MYTIPWKYWHFKYLLLLFIQKEFLKCINVPLVQKKPSSTIQLSYANYLRWNVCLKSMIRKCKYLSTAFDILLLPSCTFCNIFSVKTLYRITFLLVSVDWKVYELNYKDPTYSNFVIQIVFAFIWQFFGKSFKINICNYQ